MGTSFSDTYATIFMIWLETPIIDEFRKHIVLYKTITRDICFSRMARTEVTPWKLLIPASARSTGISDAACWRRGPRPSKTTLSFMNIADVFCPTETHLEQISFGEASTSRSSNCGRQDKAPGGPSSRRKPSLQPGARCRWHLFYDGDYLRSQWGRRKASPKSWAFPSPAACCDPSAVEL